MAPPRTGPAGAPAGDGAPAEGRGGEEPAQAGGGQPLHPGESGGGGEAEGRLGGHPQKVRSVRRHYGQRPDDKMLRSNCRFIKCQTDPLLSTTWVKAMNMLLSRPCWPSICLVSVRFEGENRPDILTEPFPH